MLVSVITAIVFNAQLRTVSGSPECPPGSRSEYRLTLPCAQPVFGRVRVPDRAVCNMRRHL